MRGLLVLAASAVFLLWIGSTVRGGFDYGAVTSRAPGDLHIFWVAGREYLHGRSPYATPTAVGTRGGLFVYPAAMAALFAPLGWLPFWAATLMWTLAAAAALLLALRLSRVRDSLCYAAALASFPVVSSITVGTLTPFLFLAAATLWRWRNRPVAGAITAAFLVASKLFLWPLGLWLVVTRRYRAAVSAAVIGFTTSIAAWARIDFGGLRSYPALLHRLTLFEGPASYQPVWLLPGSPDFRFATLVGLAGIGAVVILLAARRLTDEVSFRVAVGVALAVSPILWAHYFALVILLLEGAFSAGWLLLLAFWISPSQVHSTTWRESVLWLTVASVVTLSYTRPTEFLQRPASRQSRSRTSPAEP